MKGRDELVSKIARSIHQWSGHVEDHEGAVGGCYRAAEEVVGMLPPDLASARMALEELIAKRDEVEAVDKATFAQYRKALDSEEAIMEVAALLDQTAPEPSILNRGMAMQILENLRRIAGLEPISRIEPKGDK